MCLYIYNQLPVVLAPYTAATGPVDNCTSDLNTALSSLLDSVADLTTSQRGLQPGLLV